MLTSTYALSAPYAVTWSHLPLHFDKDGLNCNCLKRNGYRNELSRFSSSLKFLCFNRFQSGLTLLVIKLTKSFTKDPSEKSYNLASTLTLGAFKDLRTRRDETPWWLHLDTWSTNVTHGYAWGICYVPSWMLQAANMLGMPWTPWHLDTAQGVGSLSEIFLDRNVSSIFLKSILVTNIPCLHLSILFMRYSRPILMCHWLTRTIK